MMTDIELKRLLEESVAETRELEAKYRRGEVLSRQDCNRMSRAVQRLGLIAKELWLLAGRPDGFPELEKEIKRSPLPASMMPLDLTTRNEGGAH